MAESWASCELVEFFDSVAHSRERNLADVRVQDARETVRSAQFQPKEMQSVAMDSGFSGSPSFIAVVQSTDLWHRHDGSHFRRLNRSWLRCVLPQRKMGSRSMVIIEIQFERLS
jgi:hypothetical protein